MGQYLSPGVYVEEVPSAIKAIAGVSTSTPGFIGVVPDTLTIPISSIKVMNEQIGRGDATLTIFNLAKDNYPVNTHAGTYVIRVGGTPVTNATLSNENTKISQVKFDTAPPKDALITGDYTGKYVTSTFSPIPLDEVKLCTNFSEFIKFFGGFSTDTNQLILANAVYGFFNNGGSRCYVVRIKQDASDLDYALNAFAKVDEIALVAFPGTTDDSIYTKLENHCQDVGDRFAILDGPESVTNLTTLTQIKANGGVMPPKTDYAAWYFPWIKVFDASTKLQNQLGDGTLNVPPSGHLAGIYARVDTDLGVHKAPANEVIRGALNVSQPLSKADQDGLNPKGVNCIRVLNDNILVWGGRTVGGDANVDLKYINVRRTLLFLRKSIDQGTQWVVFEPNTPALWQKITRNVTAFLTNVWRSGALFGNTPQEAFYVKCDSETNPPELRELGQVVTEIGVAIVRPAEFVIFRISQWAGPGK